MKLIDLLVQELPKRGGWPAIIESIAMHEDGDIFFDGYHAPKSFSLPQCSDGWSAGTSIDNTVTIEEYEAALAASHQPAWNGEGLPPVGCECEFQNFSNSPWKQVRVVHYSGDEVWLKPLNGGESFVVGNPDGFRPIRTEADRKRDEAIDAIQKAFLRIPHTDCIGEGIWEHIAEGKIPHVKLETN